VSEIEVTVTFTEEEARSLVPWVGVEHSTEEWNRRLDRSEDAVAKIRAALREQTPKAAANQTSMEVA
jgi:hypothetical protein